MTAQTRVLNAHVPLGLAKKVEAMAARLERSRGWVMKQALGRLGRSSGSAAPHDARSPCGRGRRARDRSSHCPSMGRQPRNGQAATAARPVRIRWTSKASSELERLHDHLGPFAPEAAARVVQPLTRVPKRLLDHPRIGEKLVAYEPREVRRIIVGWRTRRPSSKLCRPSLFASVSICVALGFDSPGRVMPARDPCRDRAKPDSPNRRRSGRVAVP